MTAAKTTVIILIVSKNTAFTLYFFKSTQNQHYCFLDITYWTKNYEIFEKIERLRDLILWSFVRKAVRLGTGKREKPSLHYNGMSQCSILFQTSNLRRTVTIKKSIIIHKFQWLILVYQMRFGVWYFHICLWHPRRMPLPRVNCGLGLFVQILNFLDTFWFLGIAWR